MRKPRGLTPQVRKRIRVHSPISTFDAVENPSKTGKISAIL